MASPSVKSVPAPRPSVSPWRGWKRVLGASLFCLAGGLAITLIEADPGGAAAAARGAGALGEGAGRLGAGVAVWAKDALVLIGTLGVLAVLVRRALSRRARRASGAP